MKHRFRLKEQKAGTFLPIWMNFKKGKYLTKDQDRDMRRVFPFIKNIERKKNCQFIGLSLKDYKTRATNHKRKPIKVNVEISCKDIKFYSEKEENKWQQQKQKKN